MVRATIPNHHRAMQGTLKNAKEDKVINNKSFGDVLLFCSPDCGGLPINADFEEKKENLECPVCYVSLNSGKISILDTCSHAFCMICLESWDIKYVDI